MDARWSIIQQRSRNLLQWKRVRSIPSPEVVQDKAGKGGWRISSTNRWVRTYQITASGLRYLEEQLSSFDAGSKTLRWSLMQVRPQRTDGDN